MQSPKLSVFIAMSLDGFIARKNGSIDWLEIVQKEGEDYGYEDFFSQVDAILMGRNTYEKILSFDEWPFPETKCFVVTSRDLESIHGEFFIYGTEEEILHKLSEEGFKNIYVDGGTTISKFLNKNLVTDINIAIIPIFLGDGIRLFKLDEKDKHLKFITSKSFDSGLVQIKYSMVQNQKSESV
jgi:dihydrofolate reductase